MYLYASVVEDNALLSFVKAGAGGGGGEDHRFLDAIQCHCHLTQAALRHDAQQVQLHLVGGAPQAEGGHEHVGPGETLGEHGPGHTHPVLALTRHHSV